MNLLSIIKKKINFKFKIYLKYWFSTTNTTRYNKYKGKKKVIITLAADYGNLGDVAITYAQTKMLKEKYMGYEIIELPISQTVLYLKTLKRVCSNDDIITIVGGGNMGDLYKSIEFFRQLIIKIFPQNKIISFPQTIDFTTTSMGGKELKKAKKIYNNHKNLTLLAREKKSFDLMKKYFPNNNVLFTPDIVLTLNNITSPQKARKYITLCLRNDKEKFLPSDIEHDIIEYFKDKESIQHYDTHINQAELTIDEREQELSKIWNVFFESKLVITDRLHGMIFCYITKTPCIVLPNNNAKIKGCYEWIQDSECILLLEKSNTRLFQSIISEWPKLVNAQNKAVVKDFSPLFNNIF